MKTVFEIYFEDLTYEKQEEIVNSLKDIMREAHKDEGQKYEKVAWHDPKPMTWQEAYLRSYAIDDIMYRDYEAGDTKEMPNFIELYEDYLEDEARKVASSEIRHIGAEVEV